MEKGKKDLLKLILALTILIVFSLVMVYLKNAKIRKIDSFEECIKAGNPIMEIYPPICTTSDGRSFTQKLSDEEKKNLLPPSEEE